MSKEYNIDEVPEGTLPITFSKIDQYQRKDPGLVVILKCTNDKTGFLWRQEYYQTCNTQ